MQLYLTTKIWKEGRHYIAYTPELDIASQGKSPARAEERLREAVELFIDEAKRMRTLGKVLRAAGFLKEQYRWRPPLISISSLEVSV